MVLLPAGDVCPPSYLAEYSTDLGQAVVDNSQVHHLRSPCNAFLDFYSGPGELFQDPYWRQALPREDSGNSSPWNRAEFRSRSALFRVPMLIFHVSDPLDSVPSLYRLQLIL
jgi:hypothetical protein